MSDLKFAILKELYKADDNRVVKNKVIEKKPKKEMTNRRHAIENFVEMGAIEQIGEFIRLTQKGVDIYEDVRDQRKRERHNFLIALISVIAASIAALVPFVEFIFSKI